MAPRTSYPLDAILPPNVLVGGNTVWSRYRQYPVFSLPWLRGRSLLFVIVIGLLASITALAVGFSTRDYGIGLLSGGHLLVAFTLMATVGPALATWVRYQRWPLSRERTTVVLAVVVGIAISFFADMWASAYAEQVVKDAMQAAGYTPSHIESASAAERGLIRVVNLVALAAIYGLFGGGLALRAYFSEQRRWGQEKHAVEVARLQQLKRDSDARLSALQAQVEPHFLFNTLASVRALVRQDPARAEHTLDALVEHLRATIPKLRDDQLLPHSTLGQQLDICASYLRLMRLRIGERLHYAVTAAPSLRARPYPPLLLITLVENAVKHGIEPRPGQGRIEVRARTDADVLVVEVSDDGAGLATGVGGGMGLVNVRAQLFERYGGRASLRLESREGAGTVARIGIPLEEPQP